jgi:hypothetical protein
VKLRADVDSEVAIDKAREDIATARAALDKVKAIAGNDVTARE